MKIGIIFPGQGSQAVGMGKDFAEAFPAAREVFEEVDDTLAQKLSKLMFEGPESELTLTENAQPAIMAVSMAILRVLQKETGFDLGKKAAFVAGHSLGEYTALTAAGALKLSDTARLLRLRGQAMQQAIPSGKGAMAAILGLEMEPLVKIAQEAARDQICEIANDNAPGQVVLSGHLEAVERAVELAKQQGAKRAVMLNVSAPFHCALMHPAAKTMEEALAKTAIQPPIVPLVANITASQVFDPEKIRGLLVAQVTGRVRWRESINYLKSQDVTHSLEIGHGKVLTGLVKRIEPDINAQSVGTPVEIEAWMKVAS